MINRFIQYIRDTNAEMKHVSWPTQKQTMIFTILVMIISIVVAFYLGAFDYVFTGALNLVI